MRRTSSWTRSGSTSSSLRRHNPCPVDRPGQIENLSKLAEIADFDAEGLGQLRRGRGPHLALLLGVDDRAARHARLLEQLVLRESLVEAPISKPRQFQHGQ